MKRSLRLGYLALVSAASATMLTSSVLAALAQADDIPIIVTYELRKQSEAAAIVARHPKAFWIRQIVTRIEDKKPELAKDLKDPVTVGVTFVVARDGRLVSKAVVKPSGNAVADKTAITMLDQAAPFPPMPEAMKETELTFDLPVRFH